jgi:hypothetical protein
VTALTQFLSGHNRLLRRRWIITAAAFHFAFGMAIFAMPIPPGDLPMTSSKPVSPLTGEWQKTTACSCDELYPDHLIFQDNGIYFGRRDPPGSFTTWDAGKYEVVGPEQVRLSTANDAIIPYRYSLIGDELTFEDGEKCVFRYQRTNL